MKTYFIFPLLLAGVAGAQSPGTFVATGNMTTGRFQHTATLLLDGRVLIAGGHDDSSILSSAEIYNPGTGTFAPTGNMTRARTAHSATLLPDGRVLVAGGSGPSEGTKSGGCLAPLACGQLTSAEIFDPSSGTFTVTGDMIALGGPAVLLPNGKVFISGGEFPFVTALQSQIYDPSSGAFSATKGGTPLRELATLLANGQVLLTGHADLGPEFLEGDVYDPLTDTFSPTSSIDYQTATLLMNGKVLFIGDEDDFFPGTPFSNKTAQLYDPTTGKFTAAGPMLIGRAGHTATLLPDGTVLIAGSSFPGIGILASAELYDPVTGAFSGTGSMTTPRDSHKATLLNNGQVLITGGFVPPYPDITSSAELYTPRVLVTAPVLFSVSGDGQGQGAIWHAVTGQAASANNPAIAGEALSMYTTSLANGGVIPPQVSVGGRLAEVLYFGASGYAGYNQVNFRMPSGIVPGPAVPVRLTYLGRSSNEVTIGVQ